MLALLSLDQRAHRFLKHAWLLALLLAAIAVLTPGSASTFVRLGDIAGYPADVIQNLYRMIRVAMPWLPAGMLLALVLPAPTIRLLALLAVIAGTMLAFFVGSTGAARLMLARDMLFMIPGVAAGVWIAERSRLARRPRAQSASSQVSSQASMATTPSGAAAVELAATPGAGGLPDQSGTGRPRGFALARRLLGAALVAAAVSWAVGFPHWGVELAAGLIVYAAVLWRWPLVCLAVLPAALALLDLAPWTGRFFLDEFDLLMAVTVGMLLLRRQDRPRLALARFSGPVILLFMAATVVSVGVGLLPLAPVDASAFTTYWSPFNALRVGKGVLWGAAVFWIVRRLAPGEAVLARLLGAGMGVGLIGVGASGIWERWLFAGLANEDSTYRIGAMFSSMHTGGGHIEAYLVAALPFVWLGLFRLRGFVLALPVLVLSAYVMLYTVARAGVLGFAVMAVILVLATLRSTQGPRRWRVAAPMFALVLSTMILVAGVGGGYFKERFERSAGDWNIRVAHWKLALHIADDGWPARIFGTGLGSFPRKYLERGPADRQAATYAFLTEQGDTHLRIGVGQAVYVAQRVSVTADATYRLSLDVRSRVPGAELAAPLCEKQQRNSLRCIWRDFGVPGDGRWHTVQLEYRDTTVGWGGALRHLPVELYFYNAGKVGTIDIDRVSLLDAQGRELIGNGDFSAGGDFWFMKTHTHLPWHIKNVWLHTYFEMGAAAVLLLATLAFAATLRLARAGWQGSRLAWAFLASLAGLLTVGMFDSLLDAPRLSMLLMALLFLGTGLTWSLPTHAR